MPPRSEFTLAVDFGNRSGTFSLTVTPDGTVASVRPIRTPGLYRELDERAASWLKKWRFQPNSVTEFETPMSYNKLRPY